MTATPPDLFVADDSNPGTTLGVGRMPDHQAKWPEIDLIHSGVGDGVAVLAAQRRHSVTPFIEQTWQMNVPHP